MKRVNKHAEELPPISNKHGCIPEKKKNAQGNIYTSSGVPEQEDVNQKHIYNSNEPARRR